MSLESGRKLGLTASLINVILPIVAIVGVVTIVFSIIAAIATEIGRGTIVPGFLGFSIGVIVFIASVAILGIVGFILFIVAMYNLSHYYNEPSIFKNVLYAFFLTIAETVVIFGIYLAILFSSAGSIPQTTQPTTTAFAQAILSFVAVIAVATILG